MRVGSLSFLTESAHVASGNCAGGARLGNRGHRPGPSSSSTPRIPIYRWS